MPKCTVCTHPDFQAIDQALLAGNGTLEALSRQYGPSPSALHRHKKHLQEKIFEARRRLDHNLRQGYLFKLNQTLAEVEIASAKAQAADNVDQVFKGARVKNRLIRDLSKMETPWDTNTVYRLMASTQWQSQDCLLPTEPEFLAAGHKILAEALFHPCPEPTPDLDAEDDDDLDCVEPKSPALSSLSPEILAALHPDLLASLLDTLHPTAKPRGPHRDASAKSARNQRQKPLPGNIIINKIKKISLMQKNTRKNSPVGRESTRRAASAQAPPAVKPSCSPPVNFTPELPPETGPRPPDPASPQHQTQPPVAPDPFLQAFPYLVCKTSSRKLPRPQSPPVPATTISPEPIHHGLQEDNRLKNNSAPGELAVASRPDPAPSQEPGEIIPLNISERCYRGIY